MRSGRTAGLSVRTRSGSDGIDYPSCALIRSLPLGQVSEPGVVAMDRPPKLRFDPVATARPSVRTRSGSDGIAHPSCALIRSLPLGQVSEPGAVAMGSTTQLRLDPVATA